MKVTTFRLLAVLVLAILLPPVQGQTQRHAVPKSHPHLLGSTEELQALAKTRPTEYQRMKALARDNNSDNYSYILSAGLVAAIENDSELAKKVQQRAMTLVSGEIRQGHVTFGTDLALCGLAYDLCYSAWPEADRRKFHQYMNSTIDANVQSETHVFHNGWYGYKNWGIGIACYAAYHENERAPRELQKLDLDYRERVVPALELAGDGGGWGEGYYIHYFLYEWLFFCEVARRCEGVDYYAMAPKFFQHRALASTFETYPGISEYNTRRNVPMGDGGGRTFGGDRDKALSARRILVSHFREDPVHQAIHTFNETTPRSGSGSYAYKDFLWHDIGVARGDLQKLPLSHLSAGPGFVYARSSWEEDATYFFFKCGDRFTAHQHLDLGHFNIYRYEELAGDGGHYSDFGGVHDVNYHLRTIAHSTILVFDPEERWPANIRAGKSTSSDGGQRYPWRHHNGAMSDVPDWQKQKEFADIGDILAFEDQGAYLYVAGDATRAYSPTKLNHFSRQIVYLRPNSFVIFDRVKSQRPEFKKTWLLQAMNTPEKSGNQLIITNGKGRLFVQPLLPAQPRIQLVAGEDLYRVGNENYPPKRKTGPAPACRIEISPSTAQAEDVFLHVLTAAGAETASAPAAEVKVDGQRVQVTLKDTQLQFQTDAIGGEITINGQRRPLAQGVKQ